MNELDAETRALGFPPKPMVKADVKGSKYYRCVVIRLDYKKGQVLLQWEYAFRSASFWLPFSSDRIWAGSYKHRDWTNQGEGAWKPTPAAVAAAAAQEAAIRKAQQLAVARGGSSAQTLLNPTRQAATTQKQQPRPLKREPEQQLRGRPPKQPRCSKSGSPDTAAAADASQRKGRLAAADSAAAGGSMLLQLNQSSSGPQATPPELPSASSEAVAAPTRHAPAALLAADGAVACAAAVAAEQDTASTPAAAPAPEVPAAARLDEPPELEQPQQPQQPDEVPEQHQEEPEPEQPEQPEQPLQEQQQPTPEQPGKEPPEAHCTLAAGAALLPAAAGRSRKRARLRLEKPQPGLRPADQRPAVEPQKPSEAAAPAPAAAAAAPEAGCCEAGAAVDPAPGSKDAQQPAQPQPAVAGRSSRAGVSAAAPAGAVDCDVGLLSTPDWLIWLQLAATDPHAALSGSGTALHQLVRAVRHHKRAWGKAKARAEPQLSPGRSRSCSKQEPAVAHAAPAPVEPPGWLRWLRQDVARDPLAALAAAGDAQHEMKAADAFVRARGQAAVASSQRRLPGSLSESALSHLRQHPGPQLLTHLREMARNVEVAAAAAAAAPNAAAEAANPLPTTSWVAAAGTVPRPRSAARSRSGQSARQRSVVGGSGFSTGAAGAMRLLRSLQQRNC